MCAVPEPICRLLFRECRGYCRDAVNQALTRIAKRQESTEREMKTEGVISAIRNERTELCASWLASRAVIWHPNTRSNVLYSRNAIALNNDKERAS